MIVDCYNFIPVSCQSSHHCRHRDQDDQEFHRNRDHSIQQRPSSCSIEQHRPEFVLNAEVEHISKYELKQIL